MKITLSDGGTLEGEDDCDPFNGYGIYTHPNGTWYEGEFKDGQRNGHGVMAFPNGSRYEGEWVGGKRHGRGLCTPKSSIIPREQHWIESHFESGPFGRVRYDGEWKDDKKNGQGVEVRSDGTRLRGVWSNGLKKGSFEITSPNGNIYFGTIAWLPPHGQGVMTYPDGRQYSGGWVQGQYKGSGAVTFKDGTVFRSEWPLRERGPCILKTGVLFQSNGEVFSGKSEVLVPIFSNLLSIRYSGDWVGGKPCGQGAINIIYPDGHSNDYGSYEGGFKEGAPHGYGTTSTYKGEWRDGKRHG